MLFACATTAVAAAQSAANTAGPPGLPSILISRQLFESQHLAVGEIVSLSADATGASPRQYRVAGHYEPVADPMRLGSVRHEVRMHLPDLIDLTADRSDPRSNKTVDALNVKLRDGGGASALGRRIGARLPGISARSAAGDEERTRPFVVLDRFHLAIAIVTVIGSSIFLLALMLMLVDERRETIGILRLIGFRRRRIVFYVFVEGLVLAMCGAAAGIVLAAGLQNGVNTFFQWRYDTSLVFVHVTPRIALRSIAMAVPLGVLAAVASSWTLLRREVFSLTRR